MIVSLLLALVVPLSTVNSWIVDGVSGHRTCGPAVFEVPIDRIRPHHYDLFINLHTDAMTFEGSVDIFLNVSEIQSTGQSLRANQILLNANEKYVKILENSMIYVDESGESIEVTDFCQDNEFGNLVVTLGDSLRPGSNGKLHIDFGGRIHDEPFGLFKDRSYTAEGKPSRMVLTQFQPAHARDMFPCFDRPNLKATFQITVAHPENEKALSNTELLSSERDNWYPGKLVSRFAKTPVMSTYLVALAVGQFDYEEKQASNGKVTLRIYTPLGRAEEGRFSLEVAARAMDYLQEYFQVEYPINKLDFVSVSNLDYDGMENYGLIVCEEKYLLVGNFTELSYRQHNRVTTIHQLAHQWIGNLVTLTSWNETWLNKGLAFWLANHVAQELDAEFEHDLLARGEEAMNALAEDFTVKLVQKNLDTPDQIQRAFENTNYIKGAALVQMLHDYVGPEAFRAAIREHLRRHQNSNAQIADLVDVMERNSDLPVASFLDSWLNSEGHPLYRVDFRLRGSILVISEAKYGAEDETQSNRWTTPMSILFSDGAGRNETVKMVMNLAEKEIRIPEWFSLNKVNHFVKLSPQAVGFFHVHYADRLFNRLMYALKYKFLPPIDRLDLVRSTKTLVDEGVADTNRLLRLYRALQSEEDPILVDLMLDYAVSPNLKLLADRPAKDLIARHGVLTPESYGVSHQRAFGRIVSKLIKNKDRLAIEDALRAFDKVFAVSKSPAVLPLLPAIVHHGSKEQFNQLLRFAHTTKELDAKVHIYDALTETQDPELLESVFEILHSDPFGFANKNQLISYAVSRLEVLEEEDEDEQ